MTIPLPDFALAPLQAIVPTAVLRGDDDDHGAFMLALAAAYNDLKDLDYCIYELARMVPAAQSDALARFGQFAGMQHHVGRALIGTMHEILKLLRDCRRAVEAPEFQGYVMRLELEYRRDWDRIGAVATSNDRTANKRDALSQVLVKARNAFSFHYSPSALAKGFARHFARNDPATFSDHALVSIGENAEQTRFYYADAAAAAGLNIVTGLESEVLTHRGSELGNRLNRVLYALVLQFLDARSPKRTSYNQQTRAASSHAPSARTATQARKGAQQQKRGEPAPKPRLKRR